MRRIGGAAVTAAGPKRLDRARRLVRRRRREPVGEEASGLHIGEAAESADRLDTHRVVLVARGERAELLTHLCGWPPRSRQERRGEAADRGCADGRAAVLEQRQEDRDGRARLHPRECPGGVGAKLRVGIAGPAGERSDVGDPRAPGSDERLLHHRACGSFTRAGCARRVISEKEGGKRPPGLRGRELPKRARRLSHDRGPVDHHGRQEERGERTGRRRVAHLSEHERTGGGDGSVLVREQPAKAGAALGPADPAERERRKAPHRSSGRSGSDPEDLRVLFLTVLEAEEERGDIRLHRGEWRRRCRFRADAGGRGASGAPRDEDPEKGCDDPGGASLEAGARGFRFRRSVKGAFRHTVICPGVHRPAP
jgi:hypothetical protein